MRCSRQLRAHVDLDESCVRCAVGDDSFHQICCSVINGIPHDNIRNFQHLFQRAKREKNTSPCFWTRGMVPAEWLVSGVGCGRTTREAPNLRCVEGVAQNNCLIMFFDGTGRPFSTDRVLRRCGWGVAVLDFTDVFAPSLVFGRGGGLCPQI